MTTSFYTRSHLDFEALEDRSVPSITNLFYNTDFEANYGLSVATSLHEDGDQVCVTVRDTGTGTLVGSNPVTLTLVVYTRDSNATNDPPGDPSQQAYFSKSVTATLDGAGQTVELCADLPDCGDLYQADVFIGDQITSPTPPLPWWNNPNLHAAYGVVDNCGEQGPPAPAIDVEKYVSVDGGQTFV